MLRTLVLNADNQYLGIIPGHRGLILVIEEKARVLAEYDKPIRSQWEEWKLPAVLMMKQWKRVRKQNRNFAASTRNILIRDNFTCQYCGVHLTMANGTKDHVIPQSMGGPTSFENMVASCKRCNGIKDNRTASQSGMYPMNEARELTNEEKLACIMKTMQSKERKIWSQCLQNSGIKLW